MKSVIILAGGQSSRFGDNKLSAPLFDKTVLQMTIDSFSCLDCELIVVGNWNVPNAKNVEGGRTRTESVRNGLAQLDKNSTLVAICDGARPFSSVGLIENLFKQAKEFGNAIPFVFAKDTAYFNNEPVDRTKLKLVQTPQVFNTEQIKQAYDNFKGEQATDDSQVYLAQFGKLNFVQSSYTNSKITFKEDLPTFKIGTGFDVHPLTQGDGLALGGIKIPCDKKFVAHSDGDVLIHAIMDALLSAAGQKDIGVLFPDTNEKYKNVDSKILLANVKKLLDEINCEIISISAVVIAQKPKIAPFIDDMRKALASVLNISTNQINISATTTEKIGVVGQEQAIASESYCLCCFK